MGDSPLLANKANAFWAHREGDSSSSNFSSNMSCSIEQRPSLDSVLRPKQGEQGRWHVYLTLFIHFFHPLFCARMHACMHSAQT